MIQSRNLPRFFIKQVVPFFQFFVRKKLPQKPFFLREKQVSSPDVRPNRRACSVLGFSIIVRPQRFSRPIREHQRKTLHFRSMFILVSTDRFSFLGRGVALWHRALKTLGLRRPGWSSEGHSWGEGARETQSVSG